MLFGTKQTLEEIIVRELAARPGLRSGELLAIICRTYRSASKQALHKALNTLQSEGIAAKAGKAYLLKSSFVEDIRRFADQLGSSGAAGLAPAKLLPPPGRRLTWRFHSLGTMDDFWAHALASLLTGLEAPSAYEWVPHPWFELLHREKEEQFQRTIQRKGKRIFMMVGGRSALDRACSRFWPKAVYTYSLSAGPFENRRREYFDVVGDYILTFRLPAAAAAKIDDFFEAAHAPRDLDLRAFHRLFGRPMHIGASLEHNPKKARRLRRKFAEYFGFSEGQ